MLPHSERAVVEDGKVRDYLLSTRHPIGRFKATVFSALGYRQDDWPRLSNDLLALAKAGSASADEPTAYGRKYFVSGRLQGPNGRTGQFKTVWIVRIDEDFPRFVTAIPE